MLWEGLVGELRGDEVGAVLRDEGRVEVSALQPRPHRFTVEEYYRMGEAGVFAPGQRVELVEGEVVEMAPIGSSHADWVDNLNMLFARNVPAGVKVRVQNPLRLSDHSEPQPDLALLRPREQPYAEAHPSGPDTLLVVEVADTSLGYDREVKIPLYALRGVPEVWLFDIANGALEIFREPSADGYRVHLRPALDQVAAPAALPDLKVDLASLFAADAS
jgi:Uma2 family endonuclease